MSCSFSDTWRNIITNPTGFFKNMPKSGSYVVPLKFATINFLAGIVIILIIHIYYIMHYNHSFKDYIDLLITFYFYISLYLVVLISSINYHIHLKIIGGKGTYEGTFRQITYSIAPVCLFLIPLLQIIMLGLVDFANLLVFFLILIVYSYSLFLLIIGGKYVHNISEVRSTMAIFFPTIINFVIIFFIIFIIPSLSFGLFL